jgi:hypothetical protein
MGDFADDLMIRGLEEELRWEQHDIKVDILSKI